MDAKRVSQLLLPHLCSILFHKRQVVFPFLLLCPTHLRNRTNSSSKRHSSFIGSNIPKDEEWPFAEGQARTEWHWLTASVTQPSLTCCLPMPPLSWDSLSGCCAVSLPPISFIFASRLPFIIHGLPFYSRYKDFMPKGSLTVATNCRYCNKPHGMKAGAETHSAWMPREFPNYSCRIFVPSFCYNRQAVLSL